jgi:HAMP domain-containing protein
MTLQTRTLLMVTCLLVVAVLVTTTALTWSTRDALLAQTEADGAVIARLLARSAIFAEQVPRDVENAIGEQMVVEATIAAHLVAIAEQKGLTPDEINAHLRDITANTALNEFWITDEKGHAYLRNIQEIDFTFDPDPQKQPQAHVFWKLITREQKVVQQEARVREVDTQVFKYVGVAGIDKPRIVQVGYHATFLDQLRQQVGLKRLVDELVAGKVVVAIGVVDDRFVTLAFSAAPGVREELSESDKTRLRAVVAEGRTLSYLDGTVLKVMAPIADTSNRVVGAAVVYLPTDHVQEAIRAHLELAAVVAIFVLVFGLFASVILARRVTEPVARLTAAAAAVESAAFEPETLADVAARVDELGKLAQVFTKMAREVYNREQRLKQEMEDLRIQIDEAKKSRQVAEITETEYFQTLREKAQDLRERKA